MPLSINLVKNALFGHSWLGLFVGAAMYIICISGALVVFHAEFERWEQPLAPEFQEINIEGMQKTFNDFLATGSVTPHMYLVLPTEDSPRARISTEHRSWFLQQDGSMSIEEDNSWSEMLVDLHLYLHLPSAWGMLIVSITGAMLVALIMSGLLAHPGIFRDAFSLRVGGSKQLEQTDIHNRLSVWGAPFFLMIAITGAYFGLAIPNLTLYAETELNGDRGKAISMLFGEEPALNQIVTNANIVDPLNTVAKLAPEADPFLIVMHDAGKPNAHLSISAFHPGRLAYSENYLFSVDGKFLRTEGFVDGPTGKQVIYSIYRLHFGNFAGLFTKCVYLILGIALAVVSASGVNIWLTKRRKTDLLNYVWVGIVWGLPTALALSFISKTLVSAPPILVVWLSVIVTCVLCLFQRNEVTSRFTLRLMAALVLVATGLVHVALYEQSLFSLTVNCALGGLGVLLGGMALGARHQTRSSVISRGMLHTKNI